MNIRDFVGVIRELSFSEIRHEAMIPPRILVIAPTIDAGRTWAETFFQDDAATFVEVIDTNDRDADPLAYDVLLAIGDLGHERGREWADLFRRSSSEMLLVEIDPSQQFDEALTDRVRRRICDLARDRSVAFGRYMDCMRAPAAAEIVADTSRVNAQFAALSNIPAIIPVVGTMFAAGADFVVLTKNQLMMMYRLAAIHDRDLDDRWRVFAELAPVLGTALLWRTAARQIAGALPLALGAVPKVAIAYAGTYAVGQAARYYFEFGERLTKGELDTVYSEAIGTVQSAAGQLRSGARVDSAARPSSAER